MHLNIGDYVKVTYDFVAEAMTDLSIHCGDIVRITDILDENWASGEKIGQENCRGNFPQLFVEPLTLPCVLTGQKIFLALEDFPAEEDEDLDLSKGDIIVGLEAIDEDWWKGKNGPLKGIFPLSFVVELGSTPSRSPVPDVSSPQLARALSDVTPQLDGELALKKGDVLELTQCIDSDWFYGRLAGREGLVSAVCVKILTAGASSFSYTSENTRSHDTEITPYGRVIFPFSAWHAGELSLREFELVKLIHHVDQDWMLGEVDGHQGLLPTAFVDIIVDCPDTHNFHAHPHTDNLHTHPHTQTLHSDLTQTLHSDLTQTLHSDLTQTLHSDLTQTLHSDLTQTLHSDLTQTLHSDLTQNLHTTHADFLKSEKGSNSQVTDWVVGHEIGLVLHDFMAQVEGDVSVSEGETIEVLQQLDNNWLDIRTETGDRGIIPRNHIQLIGAWPPASPANPSVQPANPSVQPANTSVQPANTSVQPANPSVKPANPSVQPANTSVQPANPSVQPANPSVQPANTSVQPANPSEQPAKSSEQPAKSSLQGTNRSVEQSYESSGFKKPPSLAQPGIKPSIAPKPILSKACVNGQTQLTKACVNAQTQNTVHTPQVFRPHEPKNNIDTNGCIGLSKVHCIDKAFVNSAFQMDEGQMVKPNVDKGQMVKPHVDEGQMVKPHVDEGQMVKPHPPHRPPPRRPPPHRPPPHRSPPHALQLVEKFGLSTVTRIAPAKARDSRLATTKLVPKRPAPRAPDLQLKSATRPRPVSLPSPVQVGDLILLSPTDAKSSRLEDQQRANNKSCHHPMFDLQKNEESTGTCEDSLDLGNYNLNGLHEEQHFKETLLSLVPSENRLEEARLIAAQQAEDDERRKVEERKKKEEETERKREQRKKVIDEILETEKDYLHSLHLCLEIFLEEKKAPAGMDLNLVLGNMEEIADVSQKLLANLESCVSGKDFAEQCLGPCFTFYAEDMKNTYAPYCRNHDEVITMMERYSQQPEMREYFQDKLELMREHTNVFDISGVLIKPVQRILKYPLLLNELLKNTEESHCDQLELLTAIKAMTDVAKAINEYKRRKDLVYKYKKLNDETLGDKISKLTFHSIKKKSSRIRGRLSTNFGISLQMKDERFEEEEVKFRNLEKAVKIFFRSVLQFLDQSQETIKCQEVVAMDIKEFFAGKDSLEAKKLSEVVNKVVQLYNQMKEKMRQSVEEPLHVLVGLFNAPGHVIEKRFDKLLDYNHQLGKAENDKELLQAKHDYEAMNSQLLDELPKFYTLAFQLFKFCLSAFVLARRDFMDQCLKESCLLLELPSMKKTNIMEVFSIRHTAVFDQMSLLTFIPRGFNPRVDTIKADKAKLKGRLDAQSNVIQATSSPGCQTESQMKYLLQTYPRRLYQASCTYNGMDLMDISLTQGTVVGVVKDLDPMGNKERWFVDDGVNKGFVPSHILSSYSPDPSGQDDLQAVFDLEPNVVLTGNDGRATFHVGQDEAFQDFKYYYALYDFTSRHPNEASLQAGHPVSVLAFKDLDGNPEWWLVDSAGCRGYAPANYLAPMHDIE